MSIYCLMIEARPCSDNDESREFGGAFVNCWVKAENEQLAEKAAVEYIDSEGWEIAEILEVFLPDRQRYDDESQSLACYDEACEYGISAVFNTWELEDGE